MNKKSELIKRMVEIAMMAALAIVLDLVQGAITRIFPNGGSIGIAMFPIMFLALRRGFVDGFIAGLIMSGISMLIGGLYVMPFDNPLLAICQVSLDYVLAYPLVAIAGLLRKLVSSAKSNLYRGMWGAIASVLGGFAKFFIYFLSGFIFWGNELPEGFEGGAVLYSLIYNGTYAIPSTILCSVLVVILLITNPKLFLIKKLENNQ